ncbi:MAG: cell division protein FtsB [Gammaproteobacteria bacterium]|nr:cell division protein FtsB [Gammaproteobacteria bacterium]
MKILATALFLILVVLQLQLWFGAHGVFQLWSLRNTIEQTTAGNNELTLRNEQLHAEVQQLKDGEEALEERARSQLGFIKDGEIFYRVIPKQEPKSDN